MTFFKNATLALAAAGTLAGTAVPSSAAVATHPVAASAGYSEQAWNHGRDHDRGYDRGYYGRNYAREDYRGYNGASWRGRDGRQYCRRPDGTTGLLIGGAAGALIGRGIAGGGDRTLGTILGAAGGALLGREVDRSGARCR